MIRFNEGDKVVTLAGGRKATGLEYNYIRVLSTGGMWREYPSIVGQRVMRAFNRSVDVGKPHVFLEKNLHAYR